MMMRIPIIQQASKHCPDLISQLKFLNSLNISLTDLFSLILLSIHILRRAVTSSLPLEDFVFSAGGGFLFGAPARFCHKESNENSCSSYWAVCGGTIIFIIQGVNRRKMGCIGEYYKKH